MVEKHEATHRTSGKRLAPFKWDIQHRPGWHHQNADALSRGKCPGDCVQCMKMQASVDPAYLHDLQLLETLQEEVIIIGCCQPKSSERNPIIVLKVGKDTDSTTNRRRTRRKAQDQAIIEEIKGICRWLQQLTLCYER